VAQDNAKTILVVDDIPLMRAMLAKYVKTAGARVLRDEFDVESVDILEAENGLAALSLLEDRPVDLIFLDLMMPEMDGLTFLEQKKARREIELIPVIVCSALGEKETIARALNLGARAYIMKPFTLKSVEKSIRDTLGRILTARNQG
jgi:CheY-like chemotaxis protein